ncbi:hypothetical protein VTK26DRAFT_7530 [Humicola hyalothermophila]
MSYRSSRPTNNERRASDSRDRRRDSYLTGKGESNPYRDDRYRRDADSASRDQRRPSDSFRDLSATKAPRLHLTTSVPKQDHGPRSVSTSGSPVDSPGSDRHHVPDQLTRLLKKYAEAISEVTRLKTERDAIDKVLRQRQADYEKSMVKHADFPSIPEVQNMHRMKYAERIRSLDSQMQKAQEDAEKIAQSIAHIILSSPTTQIREADNRTVDQPSRDRDVSRKQHAEINDLKSQVQQMRTRHTQEQDTLKLDIAKRYQEMKKEIMDEIRNEIRNEIKDEVKDEIEDFLKEMRKDVTKELKEIRTMGGAKEEVEEMKEHFRTMRGELEKRQTAREQSQQADLQARFSKQEQELRKAVEQQLSEHRDSTNQLLREEMSALAQKESSVWRSNISDLLKRVDALTGQLAQHQQETSKLRETLAVCNQRVGEQGRTVDEHVDKLSRIDFDALEGVEEIIIAFPNLRRKVDKISEDVENKHKSLLGQVTKYTGDVGKAVGQMVETIRSDMQAQDSRIQSLESLPRGECCPGVTKEDSTTVALEPLKSTVASIKTESDSTKEAVAGLTEQCAGLCEQINQVTYDVAAASKEFSEQLEFVRQSAMNLDTRFNNLSTRALAEHIIGQLEQIYPDAARLGADTEMLKRKVENIETRLIPEIREHCAKMLAGLGGGVETGLNGVNGPPLKRRRTTEPEQNGTEHPVVNGASR